MEGGDGGVKVADGRKTEGVKTEKAIISPPEEEEMGLPSHSVYKCRPMPMIPTFMSEFSIQILIEIKRSRRPGAAPAPRSWKGLTFAVVSPRH